MKYTIYILLLFYNSTSLWSQTPIQGVINDYTVVISLLEDECQPTVAVFDVAAFQTGDRVLLIQMKGASIDSTDAASFGTVLDYGSAGNWEFSQVADISGNNVVLAKPLLRTYDVAGRLQLIRVPLYTNAVVTAPLTAQDWDGETGGVLAFWVENTLNLQANIDLTGKGFRGGTISNNPDGGCGNNPSAYYYPLDQPGFSWQRGGAEKGESITEVSEDRRAGRGPLASGGGGGNKHNTGGGGGGNFTAGGKGGKELQSCIPNDNGGLGGRSLETGILDGKLFLGGGGGCGDDNNLAGTVGVDGGGVLLLHTTTLEGNGFSIIANGESQLTPGTGIADGAGGGGGGGSLFLDVMNYSGNLNLAANGGNGGNQEPTFGCVGPGGGGGEGVIMNQGMIPLPGNVNASMQPGTAGIFSFPGFACTGTSFGAEPGQESPSDYLTGGILYFNIPPEPITLGNDTLLCPGETLLLEPDIVGATYLWQNGSTSPSLLVTMPGEYRVTVTLGECSQSDNITVTYSDILPDALGADTSLCDQQGFTLDATTEGASYIWLNNTTTAILPVTQSGLYWVDITLDECTFRDSINVDFLETPVLNLLPEQTICLEDTPFPLTAGSNAYQYLWQDGSQGNTYAIDTAGLYFVTASVGDCATTDSTLVAIEQCITCEFFIPNAISPNDDGINDVLDIFANCPLQDFQLKIFDRWGALVFESDDPARRWDGRRSGEALNPGVYVYVLEVVAPKRGVLKPMTLSGDVLVVK
ncbi:MAG: hypothetical protein DHS20C18_31940 [Saprospiraceae bacterium]|nr:MAG: hypothetical protein DHS20C18_31940 [Saprospiraceae bacterium]